MASNAPNPNSDAYMYQDLKRVLNKIERKLYVNTVSKDGHLALFARFDYGYRKYISAPTGVVEGNPAYKAAQKKIREHNFEAKNIHQEFAFFHLDKDGSYGRKKFGTKFLNKIHDAGHLDELSKVPYDMLLRSTERVPLATETDHLKLLLCNYYVYPIFEMSGDDVKFVSPPESGFAFFKAYARKTEFKYGRYGSHPESKVLFLEMCAKIRYVHKQIGAFEAMKVFVNEYYPFCIERGTGQEVELSDEEYDGISNLFEEIRDHFQSEKEPTQALPLNIEIQTKSTG
eukprot:CAMPEP_0194207502 /NCGR_PEP_ID=MMETSP0156-20130528/6225_1 /TAXON_ID=33649 /ORGANISM="Thalassionema nitzschioides, Strain L26-B" /LENGTH=285 /DNA_ID=CAMNT_0038934281 /DNA_START=89 /DNA_END=942 /DNA_ORIENTATION=-